MKLIIIAALPCVVTWLATGMFSQSVAQNQSLIVAQSQSESPQYNSADYVGSEAARMLRSFSHTTHARLTTLGSWKGRVTGRRRLPRTRQDTPRRRRSEKDHLLQEQAGQGDFGDVLLATPAVKSMNEHLQIRSKSSNRSSTEIETRGEVYGPCGAILRWLIQRGIVVIPNPCVRRGWPKTSTSLVSNLRTRTWKRFTLSIRRQASSLITVIPRW